MTGDNWTVTHHRVASDDARAAADYHAASNDMDTAVDALTRLDATDPADELQQAALWTLAVAVYARCFAEGRRTRIDEVLKRVLTAGPAEARQVHEDVIGFRNKHLAHIVSELDRAEAIVTLERRPGQDRWKLDLLSDIASGPLPGSLIVSRFRDLAGWMAKMLEEASRASLSAVQADLRRMTPDDVAKLPITSREQNPNVSWSRSRQGGN